MKGILGRKVGMTQLLTERGVVVPVTVIEAGPCYVTQIKTAEKDGYTAIQLGYQETKPRRLTKGQIGHLRRRNANIAGVADFARVPPERHRRVQPGAEGGGRHFHRR